MGQPCPRCGGVHDARATVCPVTGRSFASTVTSVGEDDVLVGSVVSERYLVREIVGQGTIGTVFRVENVHLGRPAVMKVLRPRYVTLDVVHRVLSTDARAAWGVTHPSLCEVFDVGTMPDGMPYFVMERLEGETLADRVAREPLSVPAAVDVAMQILAAMDALHERRIVLRDLRPRNVLLVARRGFRPLVKITDVGLSQLVPTDRLAEQFDAQRGSSASGVLAIPYYFSPERARNEHTLEPASDLFVVGAILYEALTGRRAVNATSWGGLLLALSQGRPTPIAAMRSDVTHELESIVLRALSGDPRARPASARQMQDDLRYALERARPGSTTNSVPPAMASASAALLVAGMHARGPGNEEPTAIAVDLQRAHPPIEEPDNELTQTNHPLFADPSASHALPTPRFDEASADNPQKTVRPPRPSAHEIEIEVPIDVHLESEANHEDRTVPGDSVRQAALAAARGRKLGEDEETETMQLTPELRQRIEQMSRPQTAPSDMPPATTRVKR